MNEWVEKSYDGVQSEEDDGEMKALNPLELGSKHHCRLPCACGCVWDAEGSALHRL